MTTARSMLAPPVARATVLASMALAAAFLASKGLRVLSVNARPAVGRLLASAMRLLAGASAPVDTAGVIARSVCARLQIAEPMAIAKMVCVCAFRAGLAEHVTSGIYARATVEGHCAADAMTAL